MRTTDGSTCQTGGHIENLATFELLRRRCRYIIVGDGEADPLMHFTGLATLIRTARVDLGVEISIDLQDLCVDDDTLHSRAHWTIGRIQYPGEDGEGLLLYLKSSCAGIEDAAIAEYRHRNPTFPHESTANQFFVEDQFEAYRALGRQMAEDVLKYLPDSSGHLDERSTAASRGCIGREEVLSFDAFEHWFLQLANVWNGRVGAINNDVMPFVDETHTPTTAPEEVRGVDVGGPDSEIDEEANQSGEPRDLT